MSDVAIADGVSVRAEKKRKGFWPAAALFFTAPLVAEFLLGNLPIQLLPALIILAPMYGGGALLIREVVRRSGRGWPSILLLGMAYGIFEEAFTTQSLFNPNYLSLNLGLLRPAYIPALQIGGWWTLWMLNVHALWSIATPIALVEGATPRRAATPWLGNVGLTITVVLFLFGAAASMAIGYRQDHFVSHGVQFAVASVVVVLLIVAAFRMPRVDGQPKAGVASSGWLAGLLALVAGSLAELIPMGWGWGAFGALLALDIITLTIVLLWARRSGWSRLQTVGMGAGAALAYGWHAFLQHPSVGSPTADVGVIVRVGNGIFLAGALCLIWAAVQRTRE